MIAILYFVLRIMLAMLHWFVGRQTRRADAKYVEISAECEEAVKATSQQPKTEETVLGRIKREKAIVALSDVQDRAEERWSKWSDREERLSGWRVWMKASGGRVLPYLTSAADVVTVLVVGDFHGVTVGRAVEFVRTFAGV